LLQSRFVTTAIVGRRCPYATSGNKAIQRRCDVSQVSHFLEASQNDDRRNLFVANLQTNVMARS
jgi:hypothetical protein